MNIRFISIELSGFRSIDKINVNFENKGTIIVKGINEYEVNASSNGSGKSSIFEGIIYALFEETSSGEKDVENRILGQGCLVNLVFEIDNVKYNIVRQINNGKSSVTLYKEGIDISARNKTDTNKLICSIIGISKSLFLDSIFLSQNAVTNLASLTPTARKERLEVLTNTDYVINNFKDRIKQRQIFFESQCVENEKVRNTLIGTEQAKLNQIASLEQKIKQAKDELSRISSLGNLEDIECRIKQNNDLINEHNIEINNINKDIENIELEISNLRSQSETLLKEKQQAEQAEADKKLKLNSVDSDIANYNNQINFNNSNINRIEQEIHKIETSDVCPTCGRKYDNVDDNHIQQTIQEKQNEIAQLKTVIDNIQNKIDIDCANLKLSIQSEIEQLHCAVESASETYNKFNQSFDTVNTRRLQLNKDKDNLHLQIQKLNDDNKHLENIKQQILQSKNNNILEYEQMINEVNKEIEDIQKQKSVVDEEYNRNNELVNTCKHIIQLITKEFRTYLLKNSIRYLNNILKEYSQKLFSNEKDIITIEESDSKLDIKLDIATYESLSGGEKTRVNIALLLAQKSLANIIGNMSCNIIILDEVLGYCDSEAENNVVDLISSELDYLESIYMISHKQIPVANDGELVVIKDKNGLSRLQSY